MNEYALNAYQHEVTSILNNKQTMFRRVMQPQPEPFKGGVHPSNKAIREAPYIDSYCSERKTESNPRGMSRLWCWWTEDNRQGPDVGKCPYGQPGDRLWVRETWNAWGIYDHVAPKDLPHDTGIAYAADMSDPHGEACGKLRPSIHMPRWASRIALEVTSVRVERVRDISIDDAREEGVSYVAAGGYDFDIYKPDGEFDRHPYIMNFHRLWDSINAKRGYSWDSNPWVWVVEFKRVAAAE